MNDICTISVFNGLSIQHLREEMFVTSSGDLVENHWTDDTVYFSYFCYNVRVGLIAQSSSRTF